MTGKRVARVTKVCSYQTGHTNTRIDREHHALQPGMRVSRTGKKYFENRRNRSDVRGQKTKRF